MCWSRSGDANAVTASFLVDNVDAVPPRPLAMYNTSSCSGGAGGIAARGQIYMGAPIGVIEIHLQLEIAAPVKVAPATVQLELPP